MLQSGGANEIKMERKSLDRQFSLQFALVSVFFFFGKIFALALATDSDRNSKFSLWLCQGLTTCPALQVRSYVT